jgi:hypothetical protein
MHGDGLTIPGWACAISFTSHVADDSGQADCLGRWLLPHRRFSLVCQHLGGGATASNS